MAQVMDAHIGERAASPKLNPPRVEQQRLGARLVWEVPGINAGGLWARGRNEEGGAGGGPAPRLLANGLDQANGPFTISDMGAPTSKDVKPDDVMRSRGHLRD